MTALDFIAQTKAAIATITEPELEAADLTNCDREPIHIPGAIQPYGVLIALSQPDWLIIQVSQNTNEHLGRAVETLLGKPLSVLLLETQIQQIKGCLQENFEAVNPLRFELIVDDTIKVFSAIVHKSNEVVILELDPEEVSTSVSFFDFYSSVKRPINRLQRTQTLAELCQVAVEEIRHVTRFDRVMVYQFDKDGAGSVVAEARQENLEPFLGLRYPPTDIPKQAKYLYLLNLLRLIPDVAYTPVPLASVGQTDTPLDMSLASLRSVSPLHTEYLTNMGVQASMSISLICDHKLWGLIACHHSRPRKLPYELRTICEFLGQVIALELTSREDSADADYKIQLKAIQTEFITALTISETLHQGLTEHSNQLMALTNSTGVAYCEKGDINLYGETPTQSEVTQLVQWLEHQFDQKVVYQTMSLSQDYAPAADFESGISGLLALSISKVQQIYILWFRPEIIQTVNWAGDPNKSKETDNDGRLQISPRQSFKLWQETVRQRSLPWKPCETEAATELRSAIIGLVLKKADELAQVNTELERSNVELDAFAYVASHDLKEPLRGIHNYSSFLIEDYGETLGEDGSNKLQTLMRLTQRMEDLINSLLHYSRLGRAELLLESVDLNDLVNGVIDVLKMSKSEPVSFEIPQPLPAVMCDRTQITELFTNLLSNAIKYNNKAEKRIEIGLLAPNSTSIEIPKGITKTVIYVKDNGIGIREKHLDAVFRIFKRLHAPGRYGGGTGAGLTIVKKIVERHGGRIWVDSVYGEGSTFYFTLENSVNE
ncbi:MAG: ATP-binding protein [Cyanobacteria bacterium P01_H01_bin.21]